jgi:hypothetical protein
MGTRVWFVLLLALCLLAFSAVSASAGYDENTWFLGAQGGYFSIPVGAYYEEYESISVVPYGIQGGYSWEFIEVVGFLENWSVNIDDGDWLMKGADDEDMSYLEYDIGAMALEVMARFKIRAHPVVQPIFGIGLGLGFVYGEVKGHDYVIDNAGNLYPDWPDGKVGELEDKDKPTAVPILELITGVRFIAHQNFGIDVNLGFKDGLYGGLGFIYYH